MHLQMNYVKLLFAHVTVLHASFLVCILHQQIGQFVKYRSMWLWIMTDARTKSRGFDDEISRKLDSVDQLSGVLCSTWQWSFQIDLGFKGLLFGLIHSGRFGRHVPRCNRLCPPTVASCERYSVYGRSRRCETTCPIPIIRVQRTQHSTDNISNNRANCCVNVTLTRHVTQIYLSHMFTYTFIPVVPHKAGAEVSKIGNL